MQQLVYQLLEAGRILLKLPRSLEQLVTRLETGQIEIRLAEEKNGRSRRGRRSRENEKSVGGFSYMVLFAVSLGAGCLFTNTYQVIPAGLLLGLAGLMGLRLLLRR